MPNKPRPGYHRWYQAIRREAARRLIHTHRAEYDALVDELKTRKPLH